MFRVEEMNVGQSNIFYNEKVTGENNFETENLLKSHYIYATKLMDDANTFPITQEKSNPGQIQCHIVHPY